KPPPKIPPRAPGRPPPPGATSRGARLRAIRARKGRLLAAAPGRPAGERHPRRAPPPGDRRGDRGLGSRDRPALHASLASELLDRREPVSPRILHDEPQPPHERRDGPAAGVRGVASARPGGSLAGNARARLAARTAAHRAHGPVSRP